MPETLWTPEEFAEYLGITPGALAAMRYDKQGPRFVKWGHQVRYRQSAIDTWLDEQERDQTANSKSRRSNLSGAAKTAKDQAAARRAEEAVVALQPTGAG